MNTLLSIALPGLFFPKYANDELLKDVRENDEIDHA